MKKTTLFILIIASFFVLTQPAAAKTITSTKKSCVDDGNKMKGSVYFQGKLFASKGKLKVRLAKVSYRLGPGKSSSDQNNILLGTKKDDSSYYKSPDSLLRTGRWESRKIKNKVVPLFTKLTFTIKFDEFWSDPTCSNSIIFNFNGLKR